MGRMGRVVSFLIPLLFFFVPTGFAQEINVHTLLEQFEERQIQCLEEIANLEECPALEQGSALLYKGGDFDLANQLLSEFDESEATLLQTLLALRTITLFQDKPEQLFVQTTQSLEKEIAGFIERSPGLTAPMNEKTVSEHQQIIETGIVLLWAQHVETATPGYQWPGKKPNADVLSQHRFDAHEWLDSHARYGFQERSSPYYRYNLAALLTIRDCYEDETLRDKCDAVTDMILADIAQESLRGFWGGAHCSALESVAPISGDRLQALLFGFVSDPEYELDFDPLAIDLTLNLGHTNFRPPPVILRLVMEYEYRGTNEIKHRFPHDWKEPVSKPSGFKYAYITPYFILGAFQLENEAVPFQTRPWDLLVLDEEGDGHHLFPFAGMQLFSGGHSPYLQEYYLWNASTFQSKNILYFRFHSFDRKRESTDSSEQIIDKRYERLPMRLWIPNAFAPVTEENGWWFSQIGEAYLAFRPIQGRSYWWRNAEFGQPVSNSASILTFQDLDTAFLLEVEEASNFSSFDQFKAQVADSPLEIDQGTVTFVSRRGDVFLFPLDEGPCLINGHVENPKTDPGYDLFSSSYTKSEYGSGRFQANWQLFSLTLDLHDPMRPRRILIPSR